MRKEEIIKKQKISRKEIIRRDGKIIRRGRISGDRIIVAGVILLSFLPTWLLSQTRWDGEANDGLWQNPLNWVGNQLPTSGDDVLFDNTVIQQDYQVSVGPGGSMVSVHSIVIGPAPGSTIRITIPADNTAAPALNCAATPYGLTIGAGGVFLNASGAASGVTLAIADSIRLKNGGRFVHATARSHADNVKQLSRSPGTEEGEFEFSIPVASSTISVSGQTFGKLRFSPGPIGSINYTGTGTNDLNVRSNLEIANGVNLSFNLEGKLNIGGDLKHDGGVLNLGSTARKLQVMLGGSLKVGSNSVISETGTAVPEIILTGSRSAQVDLRGSINNEVVFGINSPVAIELLQDLRLPYELRLINGRINTNEFVVSLAAHCGLSVPADASKSFINGRLKKEGLENEDFLFPVGKDGSVRWVGLKHATGNFLIEYRKSDPRLMASKLAAGIAHISGVEHWSITAEGSLNTAGTEISFDNVNSGGVTDLGQLRVAMLRGDTWQNLGNLATTGSAGAGGSVTGTEVNEWLAGQPALFTLASSSATQNPLPVTWNYLGARKQDGQTVLEWSAGLRGIVYFEVQTSTNGLGFFPIARILANPLLSDYHFIDHRMARMTNFYQVIMVRDDSTHVSSRVISIADIPVPKHNIVKGTADATGLRLYFAEPLVAGTGLRIFDITGRELFSTGLRSFAGLTSIQLSCLLPRGQVIVVQLLFPDGRIASVRILVR